MAQHLSDADTCHLPPYGNYFPLKRHTHHSSWPVRMVEVRFSIQMHHSHLFIEQGQSKDRTEAEIKSKQELIIRGRMSQFPVLL